MKAPLSWLSKFISNGAEISPLQAQEAFTQLGFEVENVIEIGEGLSGPITIGKVLHIEELTEFKKPIRYCQVQVGQKDSDINGIVCGASNFQSGDLVVVALPGAILPGGFQISERETYGKVSQGMICSTRELGIGEDHSGILTLTGDFQVGSDAIETLHLRDTVFDLSVLPDRGYALSIRGLARELAMFVDQEFIDPIDTNASIKISNKATVEAGIEALDDCSALHLTTIVGLKPDVSSPWELQRNLILAGMRSISLAVDITNYVMLETGQPLHAFDRKKISGKLTIRSARDLETLETLDHQKRNLANTDLVVADDRRALSLAGIMGGLDSEVSEDTNEIVLEAAHFSASRISETARRHILSSEACRRFERGVDPKLALSASDLACHLFIKYAGGEVAGRSSVGRDFPLRKIKFDYETLNVIAGYQISRELIFQIFEKIGCITDPLDQNIVLPPSWRPDLETTNDLAEEILRISGYDLIPASLPIAPAGRGLTGYQRSIAQIRTFLASNGLSEILNYPFSSRAEIEIFESVKDTDLVKIANPLSEQDPYLRRSLLPGLLNAYHRNTGRGNSDMAVFELGTVFCNQDSPEIPSLNFPLKREDLDTIDRNLPTQPLMLGLLFAGQKLKQTPLHAAENWQWHDAIGQVALLLNQFGVKYQLEKTDATGFHPGRCAEYFVDGESIGVAGEIHPRMQENFMAGNRLMLAQLNVTNLLKYITNLTQASLLSNYPVAKEDLAVVVDSEVPAGALLQRILDSSISELDQIEIFDVYQGEQVPKGKKSIAFALRFRATDRTLEATEIAQIKEKILDILIEAYGAQIRD